METVEHEYFWVIKVESAKIENGREKVVVYEADLYLRGLHSEPGKLTLELVGNPDNAQKFASHGKALDCDKVLRELDAKADVPIKGLQTRVMQMGCCSGCAEEKAA